MNGGGEKRSLAREGKKEHFCGERKGSYQSPRLGGKKFTEEEPWAREVKTQVLGKSLIEEGKGGFSQKGKGLFRSGRVSKKKKRISRWGNLVVEREKMVRLPELCSEAIESPTVGPPDEKEGS